MKRERERERKERKKRKMWVQVKRKVKWMWHKERERGVSWGREKWVKMLCENVVRRVYIGRMSQCMSNRCTICNDDK
jgi:hypothetical protein